MRRNAAIVQALLFVAAVVLVPLLHNAHCHHCGDPHDTQQCPICQAAMTPFLAEAPAIDPVGPIAVCESPAPGAVVTPDSASRNIPASRAPPTS